jgi:thiol-disulfide isomerase/thioredoxin
MKIESLSALFLSIPLLSIGGGCAPHLTTTGETDEPFEWVAPDNSWSTGDVPSELRGQGFTNGDVPDDLRGLDQFSEEVSLWQFYGNIIVVDISTMWCAPCQELAEDVEETWLEYKDQGVTYITVMPENFEYETPSTEDLVAWADAFGITAPIIADSERWSDNLVTGNAYPRVLLIDREMKIAVPNVIPLSDAQIRLEIEELL